MNATWDWLIAAAAWLFLAGTLLVTLSALPAVARRWPRAMVTGFLAAIVSFVLVLAAWGLPRIVNALFGA